MCALPAHVGVGVSVGVGVGMGVGLGRGSWAWAWACSSVLAGITYCSVQVAWLALRSLAWHSPRMWLTTRTQRMMDGEVGHPGLRRRPPR